MATTPLSLDVIKRAPKVLLHDHLDGGLRPATILEISKEIGYTLPTDDPEVLKQWFIADAPGSDLVRYLEGFAHTTAVMQTRAHLIRIAGECALDLARDGVVYAEIRFAPELHTQQGLSLDEVVTAVLRDSTKVYRRRNLKVTQSLSELFFQQFAQRRTVSRLLN